MKAKITITLDKSMYKNLKNKGVNISRTLNQMLKIAFSNSLEGYNDITKNNTVAGSNPVGPIIFF